jgi:NDP-sugar pyrophosphorylase family protein
VSAPRIAVIAAGGYGRRIHPRGVTLPKVLLRAAGKPLLTRQLELARDQLGVREAVLVIGHLADKVRAEYGDGSRIGLAVRYVENPDVDGGLGTLLTAVEPHVAEPFFLLLGDELYLETNHAELRNVPEPYTAVCAILPCDDLDLVRRNYGVELSDGRVTALVEKPAALPSPWLGCGTYALSPEIFRFARETPRSPRTGRLELTDVLDRAARHGGRVVPFRLSGRYLNVNTVEDLNLANFLCRSLDFAARRISLVIPAENVAESIAQVVEDFRPHVHEIVVMDRGSTDGTADVARRAGAVVHTQAAGYGAALRAGMEAASGDILVLVEGDGTFRAKDLGKLLEYLKDADMVIGTRTTRQMIEQGANMDGALRWGNVLVGKLIEALWWNLEPRFTDAGCTYRAIWRDAWSTIRPWLQRDDAAFSPEMMIEMLRAEGRVIEVPVSYYRRRGEGPQRSPWQTVRTALGMIRLVVAKRLNAA